MDAGHVATQAFMLALVQLSGTVSRSNGMSLRCAAAQPSDINYGQVLGFFSLPLRQLTATCEKSNKTRHF
jgi:hypothetical protein